MNSIGLSRNFVTCRLSRKMLSTKLSYEDAVRKLNALQSNKSTIEQLKKEIQRGQIRCSNIEDMENYLSRTGVTLDILDKLSVIHVAGTKGKGSTSAMCESILRHHGYRTGFYSSPHLVAVRERIRLNGKVISEDQFAQYFHQVYNMLSSSKAHDNDMPKYFAYLTTMAYYVFIKEKVDVAIIEVGIGGTVDYTNVLRKVPVVGITALGLDHTSILGDTLPKIAAAKAGIMKAGCVAYTVKQPSDAMEVLKKVAEHVQCPLYIVPDYKTYIFADSESPRLPVDLDVYKLNASLAVQLAHAWMRVHEGENHTSLKLNKELNGIAVNGSTDDNLNDIKTKIDTKFTTIYGVSKKVNIAVGKVKADQNANGLINGEVNGTKRLNGHNELEIDNISGQEDLVTNLSKEANKLVNGHNGLINREVNGIKFLNSRNEVEIDDKTWRQDVLVTNLPKETIQGLSKCVWQGRYQVLHKEHATFYLDGAHTSESMEICAQWFQNMASRHENKILIFSSTGDRNAQKLLKPLSDLNFQKVYFVIPTAHSEMNKNSDNYSAIEHEELMDRCRNNAKIWQNIISSDTGIMIFDCVLDALADIRNNNTQTNPAVLITGSLHLVGAALSI